MSLFGFNFGSKPAEGTTPAEPTGTLDDFTPMLENSPADPPPDPLDLSALVGDKDALSEVAGKMDFTAGVDPALLDSLQSLGPDAAKAITALVNNVGRQAWSQALQASANLSERGIKSHVPSLEAMVNERVQRALADRDIQANIPDQHPVAKAAIRGLASELQKGDPTLTPAKAVERAKAFYAQVAESTKPVDRHTTQNKTNWQTWLDGKPAK